MGLAQYGIQIRVMQGIHEWCEEEEVDFDVVYTDFAHDYNHDYRKLHPEYVRPVLTYQGPGIGGHCVVEATALLDHPLARLI